MFIIFGSNFYEKAKGRGGIRLKPLLSPPGGFYDYKDKIDKILPRSTKKKKNLGNWTSSIVNDAAEEHALIRIVWCKNAYLLLLASV